MQFLSYRRHDPFDDELMGLFVIVEQIEIAQIKRRAEKSFSALTEAGEAPAIQAGEGHRDNNRPGIINQLTDAAIPFTQ